MENITLANEGKIPLLGYGVYQTASAEMERMVGDVLAPTIG